MYKLIKNGVNRITDGAFIPNSEANKDWQEYLDWLSKGNTPVPMDLKPEIIPQIPLQEQIDELKLRIDKLESK